MNSSSSLIAQLAAAFAPDSAVVADWRAEKATVKGTRWVFEDIGGSVHVLHEGFTVGLVSEGAALEFMTDIAVETTGPESDDDEATARAWVEGEMWPKWEERGYQKDDGNSSMGWDPARRFWTLSVITRVPDVAALIEELRHASQWDRTQHIA